MRVRHRGKTEREYARSLQQLAVYAYKDASQLHIESWCREQFLAGLRCRDVKAHLSWFCSKDAKVHDLVSRAQALRATREENALMSDTEGNAVTVAYVQGNKLGKSFAQHQHSAPVSSAPKPQSDGKARKYPLKKWEKKPKSCVGKCCFKCGKEGHFMWRHVAKRLESWTLDPKIGVQFPAESCVKTLGKFLTPCVPLRT